MCEVYIICNKDNKNTSIIDKIIKEVFKLKK